MKITDTIHVNNHEYEFFKKACEREGTIKIIQEDIDEKTTRVHFELDMFRFASSIFYIGQMMELYSQLEQHKNEKAYS